MSISKLMWFLIFSVTLAWSGWNPHDQFTWFLEVFPAILAFLILIFTYRRFKLTTLCYVLILIHSIILMVGGHYTYAEVPAFTWLSDYYDLGRNHYDKLGHFAQGFIPAMVLRELLIRKKVVASPKWGNFLIVCTCLGFSAFYELLEWWVAIAVGEDAEAFLGTQGYVWDTQSDMFLAMAGAILALMFLGKWHDRQLVKMGRG
jgi:putative membrane protein